MLKTENLPNRSNKNWPTQGVKHYVMLMVEFLRISPSYELARKIAYDQLATHEWQAELFSLHERENGQPLTDQQKSELLIDFQSVMKTFEEFGDIRTVDFEAWWQERGIPLFVPEHVRPRVIQIARLEQNQDIDENVVKLLKIYSKKQRVTEGKPPTLLLSVPLGVNKKGLLSQISKLMDLSNVPLLPTTQRTKKPFAAKRLRILPLNRCLSLLWCKALEPNLKLWQLGVLVKLSPANSSGLGLNKKPTQKSASQRIHMSILTSRMLLKARRIVENAARGNYPSNQKVLLPYFDYSDIALRVKPRWERLKSNPLKKATQTDNQTEHAK